MNLKVPQSRWFDSYRGVSWAIHRTTPTCTAYFKDHWTFYLYLPVESFSKEIEQTILPNVYYSAFGSYLETLPIFCPLGNLAWHSGCTYYRIATAASGPFRVIKAGCDYQHIWDEGQEYSVGSIYQDVEKCIISLYELFPDYIPSKKLFESRYKKFPGEKAPNGIFRFGKDGMPLKGLGGR